MIVVGKGEEDGMEKALQGKRLDDWINDPETERMDSIYNCRLRFHREIPHIFVFLFGFFLFHFGIFLILLLSPQRDHYVRQS